MSWKFTSLGFKESAEYSQWDTHWTCLFTEMWNSCCPGRSFHWVRADRSNLDHLINVSETAQSSSCPRSAAIEIIIHRSWILFKIFWTSELQTCCAQTKLHLLQRLWRSLLGLKWETFMLRKTRVKQQPELLLKLHTVAAAEAQTLDSLKTNVPLFLAVQWLLSEEFVCVGWRLKKKLLHFFYIENSCCEDVADY